MAKRRSARNGRPKNGRKNLGSNPIVTERGRILLNLTSASFASQIDLSTNTTTGLCQFGNKLLNISDNFALFRFTKLVVEAAPGVDGTAGNLYVGFDPMVTNGAPANVGAMIELPWSMPIALCGTAASPYGFTTVHRKRVPSQMLTGQLVKWFHTRTGTFSADLVNQGTIFVRTPGATDTISLVLDYEIQFRDFVQTGLTPKEIEKVRARDSHDHAAPSSTVHDRPRC